MIQQEQRGDLRKQIQISKLAFVVKFLSPFLCCNLIFSFMKVKFDTAPYSFSLFSLLFVADSVEIQHIIVEIESWTEF